MSEQPFKRRPIGNRYIEQTASVPPTPTWTEAKGAAMKLPDIELVSAAVHEAWMQSKLAQGVTSRRSESGEELMVPYAGLSDVAKELDRGTVRAVYAAIYRPSGGASEAFAIARSTRAAVRGMRRGPADGQELTRRLFARS